jgi:hypothetical protein
MKDFKEFKAYFTKIKDEINDKYSDDPPGGISEDVTKGF